MVRATPEGQGGSKTRDRNHARVGTAIDCCDDYADQLAA
jgi:hypothetical protein